MQYDIKILFTAVVFIVSVATCGIMFDDKEPDTLLENLRRYTLETLFLGGLITLVAAIIHIIWKM